MNNVPRRSNIGWETARATDVLSSLKLLPGQPRTGSMHGAVKITIDLRPSHLAAGRLPFDARSVLVDCPARILAVANHAGANDDQGLGAVDAV